MVGTRTKKDDKESPNDKNKEKIDENNPASSSTESNNGTKEDLPEKNAPITSEDEDELLGDLGKEQDLKNKSKDTPITGTSSSSIGTLSEETMRSLFGAFIASMGAQIAPNNNSTSSEELKWMAIDRAYIVTQTNKIYADHEKLESSRNFKQWREMIDLDLKASNLIPFIETEFAELTVNVSPGRRKALDAQASQQVRSSLSKRVIQTIGTFQSAYALMEDLIKSHGSDKLRDMVDLHYKWMRLVFRPGFDQRRFVHDFNRIVSRFSEHEVSHSDRYLVTSFVMRLEGIKDPKTPIYYFYKQLDSEGIQTLDLVTLQNRFVALDLGKSDRKYFNSNVCETRIKNVQHRDKITMSSESKMEVLCEEKRVDKLPNYSIKCNNSTLLCLGKGGYRERSKEESKSTSKNVDGCQTSDKRKYCDDRARVDSRKRGPESDFSSSGKKPRSKSPGKEKPSKSQESDNVSKFHEKYSYEQRKELKSMTKEQKEKVRCKKCGEYFHSAKQCVNPGRMCYACNDYGHEARDCPRKLTKNLELSMFTRSCVLLIDSAASHNITCDVTTLFDYIEHCTPIPVKTLQGKDLVNFNALGQGSMPVLLRYKNTETILVIKNVQFVPDAENNVVSVNKFNEQFHTSCILNCKSGFITSRKQRKKLTSIEVRSSIYQITVRVTDQNDRSKNISCNYSCTNLSDMITISNGYNLNNVSSESSNEKLKVTCVSTKISRKNKRKRLSPAKLEKLRKIGNKWHRRMGHISAPYINKLPFVTVGVDELLCSTSINNCVICAQAKMTKKRFDKDRDRATRVGEILHADLIGPIKPLSFYNKNRYIVCVLDDFSRFLFVYVIKSKDQTPECLDQTYTEIRAKYPNPGQFWKLRSDKGSEFTSQVSRDVLKKFGASLQVSETNVHEHGGACERVNRTVQERIRALLKEAGFPSSLWGQVAHAACWLYNRTPHSAIDFITPYEKFYAKMPVMNQIKFFGSRCEALVENISKGQKTLSRSFTGYLIGYTDTGYWVYDSETKKTTDVCSIIIYENEQYKSTHGNQYKVEELEFEYEELESPPIKTVKAGGGDCELSDERINHQRVGGGEIKPVACDLVNEKQEESENSEVEEVEVECEYDWEEETNQTDSKPISLNMCFLDSYAELANNKVQGIYDKDLNFWTESPLTYKQAMSPKHVNRWGKAIKKETDALIRHDVWEIVPRTKEAQLVPIKWLFTEKADGTPKARLVAVGVRDKEKYEKDDTASPTPCAASLRWFLIHVVKNGWDIIQLDITNAYLHGHIDREKFVNIPPGFDFDPKKFMCKLKKSLYGLAISPLRWYVTVDDFLKQYGFVTTPREPCMYVKKDENTGNTILVIVYVDDFLITGTNKSDIETFIKDLSVKFEVKNLGFPKRFLGIEFEKRESNEIFIYQQSYIENVLEVLKMKDCNATSIPMHPVSNHKILKVETPIDVPFRSAIGYLQYLATCTRLDVAFAVGYLARFQNDPQPLHWKLVKQIIQYLKGTKNLGILFSIKSQVQLDAFADADFAGETLKRSTTGYVIRMYGCPVAWKSCLQSTIAESTSEAELIALTVAAHDILFLMYLTDELLYEVERPITVYEDNIGALRHCQLKTCPKKIKHLERKYFKVMEYVAKKIFKIAKVSSQDQLADVLTKPLLRTAHNGAITKLMSQ